MKIWLVNLFTRTHTSYEFKRYIFGNKVQDYGFFSVITSNTPIRFFCANWKYYRVGNF